MSIFNSTFSRYVAGQITARKEMVNKKTNRGSDFLQYTTAKNSWVRMASMTNVGGSDNLSKQWTLHGGVPINGTSTDLRYGVGNGGGTGVYFSDLNSSPPGVDSNSVRPYGYRPMPGITSVQSINKGTFGSLRQTTVKFLCWDKYQLSQLEKLYMRPGFSVFVEWGWSLYIDHKDPSDVNASPALAGDVKVENLVAYPIDPFTITNINDTYNKISDATEKYKGNYGAALGYVTNYSWQMLPNGGFECTTVIISHGNAINEIKASSNPFTILGSKTVNEAGLTATLDPILSRGVVEQPVLSNFEKIFLNLKAYKNQSEIYDPTGEFYVKFDNTILPPNNADRLTASQQIQGYVIKTVDEEIRPKIQEYSNKSPFLYLSDYKIKTYSYTIGGSYPFYTYSWVKPTNGSSNGNGFEYIQFNELFEILEVFFVPKDSTGKAIIKLVEPNAGRYAACEDTVSIDPTICLINNPYAEFLVNGKNIYNREGFVPRCYLPANVSLTSNISASWDFYTDVMESVTSIGNRTAKNDNDPVLKLELGNVYVNIDCILETYRSLITSDGVSIVDFLNALLEKISFALGGINDFKLFNSGNKLRVIDTKYLEISSDPDGAYSSKYKFDLIGLKSVCRDVKINSRVFSEQASMIAIAAANAGRTNNTLANLGDLYTSTQQHLNFGLRDRLIREAYVTNPKDAVGGGGIPPGLEPYYDLYWNTIAPLEKYLQRKVIGSGSLADSTEKIIIPTQEEVQNAYSLLNSHLMQLNGKDLDYKAIIPFELEITLDGIFGFNIGEVYTIDDSVLPEVYTGTKGQDRKVGFILTGVQHDLQNNDWTTTLKGQMCLLDNDKIENSLRKKEKDKIKSIISSIRASQSKMGYLAWAMVDYLIFLTVNSLSKNGTEKTSRPFLSGTNALPQFKGLAECNPSNNIFPYDTGIDAVWSRFDPSNPSNNKTFWGNPIKKVLQNTSKTTTTSDTTDEAKGLADIRASIANATQTSIPFYDKTVADETRTNTYLYKWWNEAKTKGYPDFPTGSFKEILVYDDGGGTVIDMSPHLYTPGDGASSNFDRWIYSHDIYKSAGKITGKDLFIYREFDTGTEFSPAGLLRSNYSTTADINVGCKFGFVNGISAGVSYTAFTRAVALDLNKLRDKYRGLIFFHINSGWGTDNRFVRLSNADASLESDLAVNTRPSPYLIPGCTDVPTTTPEFKTSEIPWYVECK